MNQQKITLEELSESMCLAANACLKSFSAQHSDKTFYAFGIETYAMYGYFQMALNTHEDFEEYSVSLNSTDISSDDIEFEKWNNPQSWAYFDFNGTNKEWNKSWSSLESRITSMLDECRESDDCDTLDRFHDDFKQAGINTMKMLLDNDSLSVINKTNDFKTIVYEHSDVW